MLNFEEIGRLVIGQGVWSGMGHAKSTRKRAHYGFLALAALVAGVFVSPQSSRAAGSVYDILPYNNPACGCCILPGKVMHEMIFGGGLWMDQTLHEWLLDFFDDQVYPALQDMTADLVPPLTIQTGAIGTFFDAQAQLDTMRSLQLRRAEIARDETPSGALCRFGSIAKGVAASESKTETVQIALSEKSQNRQLVNRNSNAALAEVAGRAMGQSADKQGRFDQFLEKFCDMSDNNAGFRETVDETGAVLPELCKATAVANRHNRDIDVTRTLDAPLTLDVKFTSPAAAATEDEENILALASNLYAHDIVNNVGNWDLTADSPEGIETGKIAAVQDLRSALAKRSVAENSFAAITAMKAAGTGAPQAYMKGVLQQLGLTAADIDKLIGLNPSYFSQMEVLARKLYQDPAFYVNLLESPGNVQRQQAALKSVSLMQQRDIYDSLLRTEMLMSTLLEIYVMREQEKIKKTNE
jgi:hypothetical protein